MTEAGNDVIFTETKWQHFPSLAAVDMHTARHLLENYLCGSLMRDRTVILATHHLSLCLPSATYLVKLANGKIAWQGNVGNVQNSNQLEAMVPIKDVDSVNRSRLARPAKSTMMTNGADSANDSGPQRDASKGKLVEEEHRAEGRVLIHTYLTYIRAAGWAPWITTLCFVVLQKLISVLSTVRVLCFLVLLD